MITVIFPHKTYSENKIKIKQIIKKYGMSWDDKKSGWVNEATGDGVFIDRSVMEMILSDSFAQDMPMTLFIKSENKDFIDEFEAKCKALGGEFIRGVTPIKSTIGVPMPAEKRAPLPVKEGDVMVKLNIREPDSTTTPAFQDKALKDLQNISGRWERRKRQLQIEYSKMRLEEDVAERLLQREEIAFRKNNACWVTNEFPGAKKE